jgi:hypothetical protein
MLTNIATFILIIMCIFGIGFFTEMCFQISVYFKAINTKNKSYDEPTEEKDGTIT